MLRDSKMVGQIIKFEREKKKLTQQELAIILGVSFQAISKWENGDGYPTLEKLVTISETFQMTIDQLIIQDKYGYNPILEHQINQPINNNKLKISIIDFYFESGETIIKLKIENKTKFNIELIPCKFPLYKKNQKHIEPIIINKNELNNKNSKKVKAILKHDIPKIIYAKEITYITLYYIDCSNYDEVYLYPKVTKDFSSEYFRISKALYYGIESVISPEQITNKYSTDDYKVIVEILIAEQRYKDLRNFLSKQQQKINRLFLVNFGYSILESNLTIFEKLVDPSAIEYIFQKRIFINIEFILKYKKNDSNIRETIKNNFSKFEKQCSENPNVLSKYFNEFKSFMDKELISFLSKMWIKYYNIIVSWTIPYFTQELFEEVQELLLEMDPSLLIQLYDSNVSENSVKELIKRILMTPEYSNGPSLEEVDIFLNSTDHRFSIQEIEQIYKTKTEKMT